MDMDKIKLIERYNEAVKSINKEFGFDLIELKPKYQGDIDIEDVLSIESDYKYWKKRQG
jgi:hypothetical protein